mmetsp:Transcript_32658/g.101773  ORF Transcript_32658/g.101773 Transcript_32658/m.101773 type:complete len:265 (+) Transcript_32658:55-849(+)
MGHSREPSPGGIALQARTARPQSARSRSASASSGSSREGYAEAFSSRADAWIWWGCRQRSPPPRSAPERYPLIERIIRAEHNTKKLPHPSPSAPSSGIGGRDSRHVCQEAPQPAGSGQPARGPSRSRSPGRTASAVPAAGCGQRQEEAVPAALAAVSPAHQEPAQTASRWAPLRPPPPPLRPALRSEAQAVPVAALVQADSGAGGAYALCSSPVPAAPAPPAAAPLPPAPRTARRMLSFSRPGIWQGTSRSWNSPWKLSKLRFT